MFKEIYCAGDEQTFEFLEDVLDYVCEVFPSKYIHIGGDEAPKYRWEHCVKCQQRIKAEGLHDEEALQGWFNTRIENYLATKGKQIIGWDEILEGGLSPNATVQSWRGFEGGIEAVEQGRRGPSLPPPEVGRPHSSGERPNQPGAKGTDCKCATIETKCNRLTHRSTTGSPTGIFSTSMTSRWISCRGNCMS